MNFSIQYQTNNILHYSEIVLCIYELLQMHVNQVDLGHCSGWVLYITTLYSPFWLVSCALLFTL